MSVAETSRAFAELARLSNGPTVISNVLTGFAIGVVSGGSMPSGLHAAAILCGVLCLYIAGMILNDVVDAPIDARERPERPIPSGRVSRRLALGWTIGLMAIGIAAILTTTLHAAAFAAALVFAIVLYDVVHKRAPWSVVAMGACRGLVYLVAAASLTWPLEWSVAGSLAGLIMLYIVLLTVVARVEARDEAGRRRWLALVLPAVVPVSLLVVPCSGEWMWVLIAAAAAVGWLLLTSRPVLTRPARVGLAVQGWLAGVCLLDLVWLLMLGQPILATLAAGCFVLTLLGHTLIRGS